METVGRLLARGAWRTLRATDGTRPVDIAVRRGHQHLTALLSPAYRHPLPQDVLDRLREHLHRLLVLDEDDRCVGIITTSDLLGLLVEEGQ